MTASPAADSPFTPARMVGPEVRHGHADVGRQGDLAGGFGAERVLPGLPGRPRRLRRWPAVPPWRAGPGPPAPAVGRQVPDRPAAPGSRPSRQRDQQDCVAAALDVLLIPAGQVGTIMAVSFPISGYKCSKNSREGRI